MHSPLNQSLSQLLSQSLSNQSQSLRAKTRSDNSFATAKSFSPLAPGYTFKSVRLRGTVDRSDPSNFYQISLSPNASLSGIAFGGKVKKAPLQFSGFLEIGGVRQPASNNRIPVINSSPQFSPINSTLVNITGAPIKLYFRVSRVVNRTSDYSIRVNFFQ